MDNTKPYHTIGEWTFLTEWFNQPTVDSTNFTIVDLKNKRPNENPVSRASVIKADPNQPR